MQDPRPNSLAHYRRSRLHGLHVPRNRCGGTTVSPRQTRSAPTYYRILHSPRVLTSVQPNREIHFSANWDATSDQRCCFRTASISNHKSAPQKLRIYVGATTITVVIKHINSRHYRLIGPLKSCTSHNLLLAIHSSKLNPQRYIGMRWIRNRQPPTAVSLRPRTRYQSTTVRKCPPIPNTRWDSPFHKDMSREAPGTKAISWRDTPHHTSSRSTRRLLREVKRLLTVARRITIHSRLIFFDTIHIQTVNKTQKQ